MPRDRYAAFLSYAHRHADWVKVLHGNLERCLGPGSVFLDQVDLGSGRSWVGQVEAGLGRAEHFVLVATPEALASPQAAAERDGFVTTSRDWRNGRCHVAELIASPLPPFLAPLQRVDFTRPGKAAYGRALQELLAGLLGQADRRRLPALPADLAVPAPADPGLPPRLRSRIVDGLAPLLERQTSRRALAGALFEKNKALDPYSTWPCAASAALALYTGDDDPRSAALRFLTIIAEELGGEEPERVAALAGLRQELETLQREEPGQELLAVWLLQVVADHERLVPYFQEKAELDLLDRVYVPLELSADARTAAARAEERLSGPLGLEEVLALDPAERPWITRRWVVRGDPGAGKTTLLRHLAVDLARRQDRPWVPLYERLPELVREGGWLLDRVVDRLERAGHRAQGLAAALERAGQEGRLLLLLDGLDEVPREHREKAERLLRDLSLRWRESPLVVASRPIGYRRPGSDFRELDLLALDRERRRRFLARWFGRHGEAPDEARAEAALAHLAAEPALWDLAGNPLYLTLIALLLEQRVQPESTRTRLYDQIFDLLLAGRHREDVERMPNPETVRGALRHLGHGMTEDNRDAEPEEALQTRLYRPEADPLRADLERVVRWQGGMHRFLDDLAERTGILGPHDGRDADWRFWHRTFREALAAEELARCSRAELLARAHTVVEEGDESRWAEPYALLAGRVDDPDALVRALVATNPELGLRALATAQGLKDETLTEVLELSEDWEQRAQVYRRLPEKVGDPRRALALIDRLRRRTRAGNDLFFLDHAAREVARRSPDHASRAAEVRARLFDHVPKPPEELFHWVETPKDGRVPLWREIPAGKFWMGSPEGEEHPDEHPRHEVSIVRPFRIGVVPVTNAQYAAFDPGHAFPAEQALHPVVDVTWYEAVAFCRWLGGRLPTEEEWEYACRAGTKTRYWRGDEEKDLAAVGWYGKNAKNRTHRVGEKLANAWGLYDVHGNVWEWTLSPETDDYSGREGGVTVDPESLTLDGEIPLDDPAGVRRVIRGGGFWYVADWARAAYRDFGDPRFVHRDQGFRVVLPALPNRQARQRPAGAGRFLPFLAGDAAAGGRRGGRPGRSLPASSGRELPASPLRAASSAPTSPPRPPLRQPAAVFRPLLATPDLSPASAGRFRPFQDGFRAGAGSGQARGDPRAGGRGVRGGAAEACLRGRPG